MPSETSVLDQILECIRDDPEAGEWSEWARRLLESGEGASSEMSLARQEKHRQQREEEQRRAQIRRRQAEQAERDRLYEEEQREEEQRETKRRARGVSQMRKLAAKVVKKEGE